MIINCFNLEFIYDTTTSFVTLFLDDSHTFTSSFSADIFSANWIELIVELPVKWVVH